MLDTLAKMLVFFGLGLLLVGGILWGLGRLTGGHLLPGDIVVRRPNLTIVFPIVTSIILSLILTLIFWLLRFFRQP